MAKPKRTIRGKDITIGRNGQIFYRKNGKSVKYIDTLGQKPSLKFEPFPLFTNLDSVGRTLHYAIIDGKQEKIHKKQYERMFKEYEDRETVIRQLLQKHKGKREIDIKEYEREYKETKRPSLKGTLKRIDKLLNEYMETPQRQQDLEKLMIKLQVSGITQKDDLLKIERKLNRRSNIKKIADIARDYKSKKEYERDFGTKKEKMRYGALQRAMRDIQYAIVYQRYDLENDVNAKPPKWELDAKFRKNR